MASKKIIFILIIIILLYVSKYVPQNITQGHWFTLQVIYFRLFKILVMHTTHLRLAIMY